MSSISTFIFLVTIYILSIASNSIGVSSSDDIKLGFLLVDKVFDDRSVVVDRPLSIEIRIYNTGKGSAYNVMLLESSFSPENYTFLSGNPDETFNEILPNENVTIRFTVQPLFSGSLEDKPALVSYYQYQYSDTPQRSFSTCKRYFYILTEDQYHAYVANHSKEWLIFGCLGCFLLFGPLIQYYLLKKSASRSKLL